MTIQAQTFDSPPIQRAVGQIRLSTKVTAAQKTGLDVLFQKGSSKAVFPRPTSNQLDAVLVNTAGGVTGGDRFDIHAQAARGTALSLTTQAAERIYRAVGPEPGRIETRLVVERDAQLRWLPQETILFEGCKLARRLDVEVQPTSRFLMVEPVVFGRDASGEQLRGCAFRDAVSITQNGQPLFLDAVNMTGDIATSLGRSAIGGGAGAMASLVLVDTDCARYLPQVRALLPDTAGASVLHARLLVVRLLSADSHRLRQTLLPLLRLLTDDTLTKNWTL